MVDIIHRAVGRALNRRKVVVTEIPYDYYKNRASTSFLAYGFSVRDNWFLYIAAIQIGDFSTPMRRLTNCNLPPLALSGFA